MNQKQITRLLKAKERKGWYGGSLYYLTRKDNRNQDFNPFLMRSGKNRTKLRRAENKKFRLDKLNTANHKKVGIAYRWNIY